MEVEDNKKDFFFDHFYVLNRKTPIDYKKKVLGLETKVSFEENPEYEESENVSYEILKSENLVKVIKEQ